MGVPTDHHRHEFHRGLSDRPSHARISNFHLQYSPRPARLRHSRHRSRAAARGHGDARRLLADPILDVWQEALSTHIAGTLFLQEVREGVQSTPVDCNATVFTPRLRNQLAKRWRSAVKHANRRAGRGSGSGRTATQCTPLPTSTPQDVNGLPPNPDSPIATDERFPSSPCGFATAFRPSSSLISSVEISIRFGPVTNGSRSSQKWSKNRYNEVLVTRPGIASAGAMLRISVVCQVSLPGHSTVFLPSCSPIYFRCDLKPHSGQLKARPNHACGSAWLILHRSYDFKVEALVHNERWG